MDVTNDLKPPRGFNENAYLAANPDVAEAVRGGSLISGWHHVLMHGYREDRPALDGNVKAAVLQYWRDLETEETGRLPPTELRERVHGSGDYPSFYVVGNQIAQDIDSVLAAQRVSLRHDANVLDFGCGCGRVISHLKRRHANWNIVGCDIDEEAIVWCREHLADFGTFQTNLAWPPLALEADKFDLVYAISVFTHLPEAMQLAWLGGLARVAKPGALLCLSIHPLSLGEGRIKAADCGFHCVPDRTEGLPDFYQTSFHSREYILEKWSRYFDIVDIIARGINRHQDLVVCRRGHDNE